MARLSYSFINLLSYFLVALFFLDASAASSKLEALFPRQYLALSSRSGKSTSVNPGGLPKPNPGPQTKPRPKGPSTQNGPVTWSSQKKNVKDREGPLIIDSDKVNIGEAGLPDTKPDKMKTDPDKGNGPDACQISYASEYGDAGSQSPNRKKLSHPGEDWDWDCKFMIGRPRSNQYRTGCPKNGLLPACKGLRIIYIDRSISEPRQNRQCTVPPQLRPNDKISTPSVVPAPSCSYLHHSFTSIFSTISFCFLAGDIALA